MNERSLTILLVDDHAMMREGTRRLLEEDTTLHVTGEAETGMQAINFCEQQSPDVVILDIALKGGVNGFTVARTLRSREKSLRPAILVLTAYDETAYVKTMLQLGVKGYWLKSAHASDIRGAVHTVASGKRSIDPSLQQALASPSTSLTVRQDPLTTRELEVLRLIVQGVRNLEISKQLSISVKTVETHITSLYSKLGVQSRAEAIALAQKQGLLLVTD